MNDTDLIRLATNEAYKRKKLRIEDKFFSIDELNNLQLSELEDLEKKVWAYNKRIRVVICLIEELEKENI